MAEQTPEKECGDRVGESVRGRWLAALAAGLLGAAAFAWSLRYGFVFDERILIEGNPAVRSFSLDLVFGSKFWPGPSRGVYYRPLVTLSYAVGYAAAGASPWVHHLLNVLAHAVTCALAYLLVQRLCGRPAFLCAALFALHPVHAESVAWVPGRTDVLAALFMIASWLSLLRARDCVNYGKGAAWYSAAGILFLCAMGSKETAFVLPALVFSADWLLLRRLRPYVYEYAGMGALLLLFLAARFLVLSGEGPPPAPFALEGLGLSEKASSVMVLFAYALKELIYPHAWRIDYFYADAVPGASAWARLLSAAAILTIVGCGVRQRRRRPVFALCVFGFLVSMLPVSHLVPFPTTFAQRFLYLPSLFFCLLVAAGISGLTGAPGPGRRRLLARTFAAVLVLLFASMCLWRGRAFEDELCFWKRAVAQAPELPIARNWLGIAYRNRGMLEKAGEQYRRAIELGPDLTIARMNLSEILIRLGRPDQALSELRSLAASEPRNPDLHVNIGIAYSQKGTWDKAAEHWRRAVSLDPSSFRANLMLAKYYIEVEGDPERAAPFVEAAARLRPDHPAVTRLEALLTQRRNGATD